jgi:hypothetical protein
VVTFQQQIRRLHIAMNQSASVCRIEGQCRLSYKGECAIRRQSPLPLDDLTKVGSRNQAHRYEQATGFLASVEYREDVRVLDRRREAALV